jgi:hypothetical protein
VDVIIRNWRPSRWRVRYIAAGFVLFWLSSCAALLFMPPPVMRVYALAVLVPEIVISGFVLARVVTHSPIDRIRLGDGIDVWPRGLYALSRISHIQLGPDPAEDYVEKPLPIPLCALTVVVHNTSALKMIVSRGDALRLKEWASRHQVEVRDPLQSARLPAEPRSSN